MNTHTYFNNHNISTRVKEQDTKHISMRSMAYLQKQADPTQLRRKSCECTECGVAAIKEKTLPSQLSEIPQHKQRRLANVLLGTIDQLKVGRSSKIKRSVRLIMNNPHLFKHQELDPQTPEKSPTLEQSPELIQVQIPIPVLHIPPTKPEPKKNCYIIKYRGQLDRTNKTVDRLINSKRSRLSNTVQTDRLYKDIRSQKSLIQLQEIHTQRQDQTLSTFPSKTNLPFRNRLSNQYNLQLKQLIQHNQDIQQHTNHIIKPISSNTCKHYVKSVFTSPLESMKNINNYNSLSQIYK